MSKDSNTAKASLEVLVIGLGLIGASVAKGLRQRAVARISGFDTQPATLRKACELGIIDSAAADLGSALTTADVVMLAVPVLAMEALFEDIRKHAAADCIITDVGSVKCSTIDAAVRVFGRVPARLVPGHPIAGSENSGVAAADAMLFERHKVILTPQDHTDGEALQLVARLWRELGAEVVEMDAAQHDEVLAATSHLPHMLAYALVDTLVSMEQKQKIFDFAAGGFRDFSRIASSDPRMWHDIVLANKVSVLAAIDVFDAHLAGLRRAIETEDSQALMETLSRAKTARDEFVEKS